MRLYLKVRVKERKETEVLWVVNGFLEVEDLSLVCTGQAGSARCPHRKATGRLVELSSYKVGEQWEQPEPRPVFRETVVR